MTLGPFIPHLSLAIGLFVAFQEPRNPIFLLPIQVRRAGLLCMKFHQKRRIDHL
jgi:hypothetical protein